MIREDIYKKYSIKLNKFHWKKLKEKIIIFLYTRWDKVYSLR